MSAPVLDRPIGTTALVSIFEPARGTTFDSDGSEVVAVFTIDTSSL